LSGLPVHQNRCPLFSRAYLRPKEILNADSGFPQDGPQRTFGHVPAMVSAASPDVLSLDAATLHGYPAQAGQTSN
jgi:hypothetical protein